MSVRDHFHQAAWQEPLITEQGSSGQRGVALPRFDGPAAEPLPETLRRAQEPMLPELGQPQVLRHFTRLSQMTLGSNVAIDATVATTTPKYPPIVGELIARSPKLTELHPDQPPETVQGVLRLLWELGECLKALTGMDHVSLQAQGGAHAILANVLIMRAFHTARGDRHRDEIISTLATHPADPAAAAAAGFKVIEVPVGPNGYIEVETLKAAVSERTAGLLINNPEDSGVFNPNIDRLADVVREAGGLCAYDQANANATLGIARARESGFDLCQLNLHKTFGAPINLFGPAAGAILVTSKLARFLPTPLVVETDSGYALEHDRPESIGPIRAYAGNIATLIKAYAWIRALGEDGLREVARTAVLNNNYVHRRMSALRGVSVAFPENPEHRLDVVRYSLSELKAQTGIGAEELNNRVPDFGLPAAWTSHHPHTSPEPLTLEPTESFSRDELDELVAVYARVIEEAYTNPSVILDGPHRSAVAQMRLDEVEHAEVPPATARLLRERRPRLSQVPVGSGEVS